MEIKYTERLVKDPYYVATDGRHFDTKEKCEEYEKSEEFLAEQEIKPIVGDSIWTAGDIQDSCGFGYCYEDSFYVFRVENEAELHQMNRWLTFKQKSNKNPSILSTKYIGQTVIVCVPDYDDYSIYILGTPDEIIARTTKEMNRLKEYVEKKKEETAE